MKKFKWLVPKTSVHMICESMTIEAAATKFFGVYHGRQPKGDYDKLVLLKSIEKGVIEYENN